MARVPDFITKNRIGYKPPVQTRRYKYTPPIPALAIQFEEIPRSGLPKETGGEVIESVLGTQDLFAIGTQEGFMIEIIP
jgi:hypothetical protein